MQNLGAAITAARSHVLASLPIHRRLQTTLDCHCATLDEKITLQRGQTEHAPKGLHKLRVVFRVNVRVGDFDLCRTKEIALHRGIIKLWMIESDRHRAEESVEIDEELYSDCVVYVGLPTHVDID